MKHNESSPLANQTVVVNPKWDLQLLKTGVEFKIEDWWDRVSNGISWMHSNGNPTALGYAVRAGMGDLPLDDEVLYGKVDGLGYLVHISEIQGFVP